MTQFCSLSQELTSRTGYSRQTSSQPCRGSSVFLSAARPNFAEPSPLIPSVSRLSSEEAATKPSFSGATLETFRSRCSGGSEPHALRIPYLAAGYHSF